MSARRNTLIRLITGIGGDIAIATVMAAACVWVIQAAALGVFLSFLIWLIGAILSLALSQYVFRPALRAVMSDHKLDDAASVVTALAEVATEAGRQIAGGLARVALSSLSAMRSRVTAT